MDTDSILRSLFAAMFAYARDKLRGNATTKDISDAAKAALEQMSIDELRLSWEGAPTLTVTEAKRQASLHRPVYVLAHVTHLDEPHVALIPREDEGTDRCDAICGKVTGHDGEILELLPALGTSIVEKLQRNRRVGALVRITGLVASVPMRLSGNHAAANVSDVHKYVLHVVDVEPTTSALDLLGATADERAETRQFLDALRAEGVTPYAHLNETLLTELRIVGGTDIPELFDAISFTVLQALSTSFVGHASGRLHLLLVGPPGHGKKLVGMAAKALNPIAVEASASKVSPAGLASASHRTATGWASTPGLLPRASEGVLVVQDAQGWSPSTVGKIAPILQELIEDGVVRDGVAGGCTRVARTALILDANRTAQLGGSTRAAEAAILTQRPLLSRIDSMIEIRLDVDRSWRVAGEMYGSLGQGSGVLEDQPWVRRLRLLVAHLRDAHPEIRDAGATEALRQAHDEIRQSNEVLSDMRGDDLSAVAGRMPITLMRMVWASARAHDRDVATAEDARLALHFFRYKLTFLALNQGHVPVSDRPGVRNARRDYYARYEGQEVSVRTVRQDMQEDLGEAVSTKTIKRDLTKLGAVERKGLWLLPPKAS